MIQFLPSIIKAAVLAGNAALEVYQQNFSVTEKPDHSPLTLADTRSQAIISEALKSTDIPVLSEEGGDIAFKERKDWERLWIVDPLDGTKEFVKKNGEFTINIALVENHVPVMGVIYLPVFSRLYYGIYDKGAYRAEIVAPENIENIAPEQIMETANPLSIKIDASRIYTIVASRSHLTPAVEAFVEDKKRDYGHVEFISAGSSLKFCEVAEGNADIYPRLGPTMEWDTAAGQVVAQAAGARVYRYDTGGDLLYNKEDLKNPWFVVTNGRDDG